MREAIDYPKLYWIYVRHHDNGNCLSRLLRCIDRRQVWAQEDIDLELQEFGHEPWYAVRLSLSTAIFKTDVLPLNMTEFS